MVEKRPSTLESRSVVKSGRTSESRGLLENCWRKEREA